MSTIANIAGSLELTSVLPVDSGSRITPCTPFTAPLTYTSLNGPWTARPALANSLPRSPSSTFASRAVRNRLNPGSASFRTFTPPRRRIAPPLWATSESISTLSRLKRTLPPIRVSVMPAASTRARPSRSVRPPSTCSASIDPRSFACSAARPRTSATASVNLGISSSGSESASTSNVSAAVFERRGPVTPEARFTGTRPAAVRNTAPTLSGRAASAVTPNEACA